MVTKSDIKIGYPILYFPKGNVYRILINMELEYIFIARIKYTLLFVICKMKINLNKCYFGFKMSLLIALSWLWGSTQSLPMEV